MPTVFPSVPFFFILSVNGRTLKSIFSVTTASLEVKFCEVIYLTVDNAMAHILHFPARLGAPQQHFDMILSCLHLELGVTSLKLRVAV